LEFDYIQWAGPLKAPECRASAPKAAFNTLFLQGDLSMSESTNSLFSISASGYSAELKRAALA
jgi:hypothetical protein